MSYLVKNYTVFTDVTISHKNPNQAHVYDEYIDCIVRIKSQFQIHFIGLENLHVAAAILEDNHIFLSMMPRNIVNYLSLILLLSRSSNWEQLIFTVEI